MVLVAVLVAACALVAAALFGAAAARARRRHRLALEERGWLLERERQVAARVAVGAERARIARELHDIVSHNVSVMVVQAGAAREVLAAAGADVPPDVTGALAAVEGAGRDALKELRHLLGLLAPAPDGDDDEADEGDAVEYFAPQQGLDGLSRLVDRIAFAGLPVDVRIGGEPRALPAGIDVTAYRIIQEALTNALKHGRADRAEVDVRYAERYLRIEVLNTGPSVLSGRAAAPSAPQGAGRGLLGLRERVAVYGGDLDASRRLGGGFRVRARIPLDPA
ncbi:sensor histidine kinase [Dactylosporangium darangshiense]|uniref:histidine kinase n=1 Tax=Dactylosporangium darangshiense TaxID=579108 RepID=A0ABP8D627_9ACTN